MITRLSATLQQVQGITLYMQVSQDITIGSRLSKTQHQCTLTDVDQQELSLHAPQVLKKLQALPRDAAIRSRYITA